MHIRRVVVVVLLASLIVSSVAVFLFAAYIDNRVVLWGIRTVAVLVVIVALWRLIRIGYDYKWTGLGEARFTKEEDEELRLQKTLWDWLQLLGALAIPIVLAAAGFWFTMQQNTRQQQIEDQRAQQAQEIEDQRAEAERELAEQRAQDEALQAYLSQIGSLLLEKDLRTSKEDSEVRTLARARTLTVLGRLDPSRKTAVMQFLEEAELIQEVEGRDPIISLDGAALSGTDLSGADLIDTDLNEANLSGADLSGANLNSTDFSEANLSGADLNNAIGLSAIDFNTIDVSLEGATLPNGELWPGKYVSHEFQPDLSFIVGHGWTQTLEEETNQIFIAAEQEPTHEILFTSPHEVFAVRNPAEGIEVPAPENADEWASWFQNHPALNTSKPEQVTIGGLSGVRLDVSPPKRAPKPLDICEGPCVPLYPTSGTAIASYEKEKDRFFVVDVGAEIVIIDIAAPTDEFDEFRKQAWKVLKTVEWQ
jgi:uncharacterized protein YjbI with pentapeptide repeats